jgi:hypothetical protein
MDKYTIPVTETDCLLWIGAISKSGYGKMQVRKKTCRSHRVAYEMFVGAIPDGMFVLHKCDVRLCVNPNHLFLGTTDDNMADMVAKRRSVYGQKNPHHKLTEEQVRAIRIDHRHGKVIAAAYGVNNRCVSQIKLRQSWGWLP